jgi:hypothetical protein
MRNFGFIEVFALRISLPAGFGSGGARETSL